MRRCLNLIVRQSLLLVAVSACTYRCVSAAEKVDLRADQTGKYLELATERLELARRTLAFVATSAKQPKLIEDWDPCYLSDDGFAFVSTRNQGGVKCHFGGRYCPTYTLYRGELDGTGIRPMAFGEANEWDPSVKHDGRIIWTRWDYINRHDTLFQSLWTTRPDGTSPEHFYGNYTRNPCSIAEARAIPDSQKVVATATAHHSYTAGSIIVVDPLKGDGQEDPWHRTGRRGRIRCFPRASRRVTGIPIA